MASTARDNFFKNCPAVMDYSSFTDYRTASRREQYIRSINNITSDYQYKNLLQRNADKIMEGESTFLTQEFACNANVCIHNSPTSPAPGDFNVEMARYNAVRVQGNNKGSECTPQQKYKISH
jgi:hypothetical protein